MIELQPSQTSIPHGCYRRVKPVEQTGKTNWAKVTGQKSDHPDRTEPDRARSQFDLSGHFVGVLAEIGADVADSTRRSREPRHDAGHRDLDSGA